jgi:hypothetical protein
MALPPKKAIAPLVASSRHIFVNQPPTLRYHCRWRLTLAASKKFGSFINRLPYLKTFAVGARLKLVGDSPWQGYCAGPAVRAIFSLRNINKFKATIDGTFYVSAMFRQQNENENKV